MSKSKIIDFHTHTFPESVAARAIPALEKAGNVQAHTDGTTTGLLASMDRAGIEKSVLCSIATRVEQFQPILDWSKQVRSKRLIPLPSLHPEDPQLADHVRTIKEEGFIGIKMHPYYQDFFLTEDRMTELYQTVTACDLLLVMHTGFDIAYPRDRRADPAQVVKVLNTFPDLKLITTHLGGWDDWHEVHRLLVGRPVYMEISFALDFLSRQQARNLINSHLPDYILFGTDSPWADQATCLQKLHELGLDEELLEKILRKNAEGVLQHQGETSSGNRQ
jgi:predicted TIM-barrel fold metal-dependent hydrolase